MSKEIVTTIISGVFSVISAFGAIYFKEYLDRKKEKSKSYKQPRSKSRITPRAMMKLSVYSQTPNIKDGFKNPIILLAISFGIGIITRLLQPVSNVRHVNIEGIIAIALILIICGIRLIHWKKIKKQKTHLLFQLELIILWAGFVFGWSIIQGRFREEVISTSFFLWLLSTIVGGIILSFSKSSR